MKDEGRKKFFLSIEENQAGGKIIRWQCGRFYPLTVPADLLLKLYRENASTFSYKRKGVLPQTQVHFRPNTCAFDFKRKSV